MTCAYDEMYLSDAMDNLGEMIEYAVEACREEADRILRMLSMVTLLDFFSA